MSQVLDQDRSTDTYRRSARRLRARFSRQPALLHHALSRLADQHNSVKPSVHRQKANTFTNEPRNEPRGALHGETVAAIERAFATHVAAHLEGDILRYSNRVALLAAAERLHINRFRANLIIAMVQHEQPAGVRNMPATVLVNPSRSSLSVASLVTLVLTVELGIAAAVFLVIRGL